MEDLYYGSSAVPKDLDEESAPSSYIRTSSEFS
jgi:hypothetical protein